MRTFVILALTLSLGGCVAISKRAEPLQGYIDTLREINLKLKQLGREVVCGDTVTELLELLDLPDIMDGMVASARGWICDSVLSSSLNERALAAQPQALEGYFDTLIEIYNKLKELGHEMVCGPTVTELLEKLGLPETLYGMVSTAQGWLCDAIYGSGLEKRDVAQPLAVQGYFDTLIEIYYKLKELGHDIVCGQTVSELIELLGLPETLDGIVETARGWICNSILS